MKTKTTKPDGQNKLTEFFNEVFSQKPKPKTEKRMTIRDLLKDEFLENNM